MKDLIKTTKNELENGLIVATNDLKSRVIKTTTILNEKENVELVDNLKTFKTILNQKVAITYTINEENATSFRNRLINSYKLTIEKEGAIQYSINLTNNLNNTSAVYTQLVSDLLHLIGFKLGYNTSSNGGRQNNKYFGAIAEALGFEVEKVNNNKHVNYNIINVVVPNEFKYTPIELHYNKVIKTNKKDKKPTQRERLNALVERYSKLDNYKPIIDELKAILNIK